jgi:hypothetical protein
MCGLAFPCEFFYELHQITSWHLKLHITPALIDQKDEFSAGGLCGKSAPIGGWFNTFPIPFYKSALVVIDNSVNHVCFYNTFTRMCLSGYGAC